MERADLDALVGPSWQIRLAVAAALVVVACITERRTAHIPNWLTFGGLAVAAGLALWDGAGTHHLLGLLAAGTPALLAYRARRLYGGAVKLVGAAGAVAGPCGAAGIWVALPLAYLGVSRGWLRLRPAVHHVEDETMSSPFVLVGLVLGAVLCWLSTR